MRRFDNAAEDKLRKEGEKFRRGKTRKHSQESMEFSAKRCGRSNIDWKKQSSRGRLGEEASKTRC